MDIIKLARPETLPEIPRKIRWKAGIFGKHILFQYFKDYYERESMGRVPFYLPYIYIRENFDYLRRFAKLPRHQISVVLIDGNDGRLDYFLYEFLDTINFLTIVTDRKAYFESLQERAFQELGLIIELVHPWEDKSLQGNMVWDFTEQLQKTDCYPKGSICFLPHKKEWKIKELLNTCERITAVSIRNVEIGESRVPPAFAEALLVPGGFAFRKSRCEELKSWCKERKWRVKLTAQTL